MDELFNTKVFEASIKKCFAEVINERFNHLLRPTISTTGSASAIS